MVSHSVFWKSHNQFTWHEIHVAWKILFAPTGFGKYAFWMDVTMALICICNRFLSFIPMGSAGMLFCCSSNSALILSILKGDLSVILRDGWQNLCACVHTDQRKHSMWQKLYLLHLPLMIRVTLFIFVFLCSLRV